MKKSNTLSLEQLKKIIVESLMDETSMEDFMPGQGKRFSKTPTEKVRMPVKSAAEAFQLAVDGEEEFQSILKELTKDLEGVDISRGRIKSTVSLERKCRDYGLEVADLDDVSGKALIVKSIKDMEVVGKLLKDDPRTFRIFDFYDEPDQGYYGIHANYRLSNGLVAEIQVRTIRLFTFMATYGHIIYEVRREMFPKAMRNKERYGALFKKYDTFMVESMKDCRRADEQNTRIPRPVIDLSEEEMALIKECVAPATYDRFQLVLSGKAKDLAYGKNLGPEADRFITEGRTAKYYRGCSREEAEGSVEAFPLWLTDDMDYAMEYANDEQNGRANCLVEYDINESKIKHAGDYVMEEIADDLGVDWDPYDPDRDILEEAARRGFNAYSIEEDSYILVLLDKAPVIRRKIVEK